MGLPPNISSVYVLLVQQLEATVTTSNLCQVASYPPDGDHRDDNWVTCTALAGH